MNYGERILKIMGTLTDEGAKALVDLKKTSITDLVKAKAEVQSWWMNCNSKEQMQILFTFNENLTLVLDYSWLRSEMRKILAGIFIIRQRDKDYLPN